jgi:putative ABC transport system permease protein
MHDWKHYVRERLSSLGLAAEREMEIVEELANHLESVYEDALARGASEQEASERAIELIRDWRLLECEVSRVERPVTGHRVNQRRMVESQTERRKRGAFSMESLIQDLRYGMRTLSKNPGFTLVAVLALALGIGANTAIFSIVNAVLLRPLPYPDSERLVTLFNAERRFRSWQASINAADFVEWREQQSSFEGISIYTGGAFNLTGGSSPAYINAKTVSAEFFSVLGVQPLIGRGFLPEENQPGKGNVVVLCHALWQQHFNSDPQVAGKTVKLDGESYTVVGVMPEGFRFVDQWQPDIIVPLEITPNSRGNFILKVIARLKPGVTLEQAQKEMQTTSERLEQARSGRGGLGARLVPLRELTAVDNRLVLGVLFGAVGFVLLIACANLANLFLARSAVRKKEIAVRAAVGASRWRLVRQLLTESLILAMLGGLLGLLLAVWSVKALVALAPQSLPKVNEIGIDLWVLGFTFLVSLLTGALFGIAPALQSSKPDLVQTLKEGGRARISGFGRFSIRGALVIGEVAIALVLLAGAGLMLNSVVRLILVDRGFASKSVLVIGARLPDSYRTNEHVAGFYDRALTRMRSLPGVAAAGAVDLLPLGPMMLQGDFSIEGRPPLPEAMAVKPSVSPDYFRALGIPVIRGREFNDRDTTTANKVAIVSESLVRRYFEGEDLIGKRISIFNDGQRQPIWLEVVGVVGDVRQQSLSMEMQPGVYTPLSQARQLFLARNMNFVIRAYGDPMSMAASAQREIQQVDPDLPMISIRTMDQVVSSSISGERFNALLLGIFAALALVLAAVGIYGVMAFSVAQRTHEIGIRMALGAQVRDVLRLVIKQGMILVLIGVGVGLIAALALTRMMKSLLFEVSATDPTTLVVVTVALIVVALLACWIPARRATRVDPTTALRFE